jgi:DNA uptake protein ComE-like DNA-binding protein
MKTWKFIVKEYFTFSRSERNASLLWAIVVMALLVVLLFVKFYPVKSNSDFKEFNALADSFARKLQVGDSVENSTNKRIYYTAQSDTGQFRPYHKRFDSSTKQSKPHKAWATHENYVVVELNAADSAALVALPQIGPSFARRIIKYRELLGGFVKPEQLLEVYGFDSVRYNVIKSRVCVDSSKTKKINLNTVEFKVMATHPYLGKYYANAILQFRKQFARAFTYNELVEQKVIPNKNLTKIQAYLTW